MFFLEARMVDVCPLHHPVVFQGAFFTQGVSFGIVEAALGVGHYERNEGDESRDENCRELGENRAIESNLLLVVNRECRLTGNVC